MFVPPSAPPPSPARKLGLKIVLTLLLLYLGLVAVVQWQRHQAAAQPLPPLIKVDAEITGLMGCDRKCNTTTLRYGLDGHQKTAAAHGQLGRKGEQVSVWVDPGRPLVAYAEPWQREARPDNSLGLMLIPVVPAVVLAAAMLTPASTRRL